jgi:hypothetical protein
MNTQELRLNLQKLFFTLCPFRRFLLSSLFLFVIIYHSKLCLIRRLLLSTFCYFVIAYHSTFFPFEVFYYLTFV